jgi:hypothetical protein
MPVRKPSVNPQGWHSREAETLSTVGKWSRPEPFPPPRTDIRFRDRVRVPGGRIGSVVGFYRTKSEMALVQFDDGERRKFVLRELKPAAQGRP